MLSLLLYGALLLPQAEPVPRPAAPDPAAVARAESEIEQALRSGDAKIIAVALEAAQSVPHPAVVRKVVRAAADERLEVRLAAVQALRWLDHPSAVEALHRLGRERKVMKAPEVAAAVLRAIGQHADPTSVAILAREPFEPETIPCLRARILGLARIRTLASLEALMDDARIALMLLTGVDQGRSPELWERWWRDNRKTFAIPTAMPLLPRELRDQWNGYWGLPREYERNRARLPCRPGSSCSMRAAI
jgi:hypothetical protein